MGMDISHADEYWRKPDNQTKEHHELSGRCLAWLGNRVTGRGMRAEQEIFLGSKYVADAVAIASLQQRHYEGILDEPSVYGFAGQSLTWEDQQRIQNRPDNDFIFVFEAKVSKGDFNSTFGKNPSNRLQPVGSLHFIVTPKGLLAENEVPTFWGLLEASGRGLRMTKRPQYQKQSQTRFLEVGYQLLWKSRTWHSARAQWCPDCHKEYKTEADDDEATR